MYLYVSFLLVLKNSLKNKMLLSDFKHICRTCHQQSTLKSLFQYDSEKGMEISGMLEYCTSVIVKQDDGLPEGICNECFNILCSFYEFKQFTIQNIDKLKRLLGKCSETREEIASIDLKKKENDEERFDTFDKSLVSENESNLQRKSERFEGPNIEESTDITRSHISAVNNITNISTYRKSADAKCTDGEQENIQKSNEPENCSCTDELPGVELEESRNFQCNSCGKILNSQVILVRHTYNKHSGARRFECDLCNKKFIRAEHLRVHKRVHTGEKPHKCKVCSKSFAQYAALSVHSRIHSGEKPFMCSICGKAFNQSVSLTYHLRTHTGETPYQCQVCNKGFAHSGNLNIHMRFHRNERPHVCTMCGKSFVTSSHLTVHVKQHLGDKQHHCKICSKSFVRSQHLKDHMVIHTGQKPHICQLCHKSYTQSSHLKRHMKSHS